MTFQVSSAKVSAPLKRHIEALADQDLLACYQCGKCSAGCPMATPMDFLPNQIIRMAQLGMVQELLGSESIWTCVSCLTCNSRCPKGVRIAEIIEAFRQVRLRESYDRIQLSALSEQALAELPAIAVVASTRKLTA